MNKKIIIGNWKCNPIKLSEAVKIFNDIKDVSDCSKNETIICPPNIFLKDLLNFKSSIKIGAQNCFSENQGAYTGEVSALMLKNLGCKYVILGHSERRKINQETNEEINKKIISAFANKLIPILCIGESREEREHELTFDVLKKQIEEGINKIEKSDIQKIIFAYEPIWSIGTGNFAAPEQIKDVREFIINLIYKKIGKENSKKIRIIYGGSVTSENVVDYFKIAEMDGVLVGGASLKPKEFSKIIRSA
jgi:triosephosphate isomerase